MDCVAARGRLLEADLEELDGRASTELGRHLASCHRCRATAQRIVEGERAMAAALDDIEPPSPYSSTATVRGASARPHRMRWLRWIPAIPVAAALAGLMLVRSVGRGPELRSPPSQITRAIPTIRLDASDGNMVVLETDNPKITVLWFY